MSNRFFKDRLNHELDSWNLPERIEKRVEAFSKLANINRTKAQQFMNGIVCGDVDMKYVQAVADKFEVQVDWLLGKSDHKHASKP